MRREESKVVNKTDFKKIIGTLLYISTKRGPIIAFAVN